MKPSVARSISRRGKPRPTGKQKNILEKRLLPWTQSHGGQLLKNLDVDAVRRFRATWDDAPITAAKNLERLRNFLRFCVDSKWLFDNPARAIKPPRVTQSPTLPFEDATWTRLIDACDEISPRGPYREGNRTRMKAMLQLLRASGLRIRDAATLERRRIKDGKLFLYTQKTGTPVYVPLPPAVLDALNQLLEQLVRKLHVGVFRSPSTSSITKGPVGRTFRSAVVDAVGPDL